MCGCKDCKEITLLGGMDGVGIASIVSNSFGTVTYTYTNGQTVTLNCGCGSAPVYYRTERLGQGTSAVSPAYSVATNMTYTVPSGGAGVYELEFVADTQFDFTGLTSHQVTVQVFKNGLEIDPNVKKRIKATNFDADGSEFIIPAFVKVSNVNLAVGDVITVVSNSTAPNSAYLNFAVLTINQIG